MQRNSDKVLSEWLVLNAQSGKAEALNQLLIIWQPKFLRYSSRQLQNLEAAQDVVQETLIIIAKQIRSLKDPVSFPRWSYQILHRRGVDYLRHEIRKRQVNQEHEETQQTSFQHDIKTNNLDSEIDVKKLLSQLDETHYMLVHLYYLEGLTQKEIAAIMKIPIGTVKSKLHYTRNQLRTLLEGKL